MRQSEQSKTWMVEALFTLMKTKPYSAITIKDITEKAGVSRLTFYRNFETKEDIIRYHMLTGFWEYMAELKHIPNLQLKQMIALCYRFWDDRKEEIQMLSSQILGWLIREPFEKFLGSVLDEMGMSEKYSYFQIQFLIGGMLSDMLAWLDDPKDESPEDIAEEIIQIIK